MALVTEREEISREISDAADASKEDARGSRRRGAYFWAVMVVYMVAGPAVAIWVSQANQHRSERAWCGIITTLDDTYRATPPTTPVGRQIAAAMAKLRRDYRCP